MHMKQFIKLCNEHNEETDGHDSDFVHVYKDKQAGEITIITITNGCEGGTGVYVVDTNALATALEKFKSEGYFPNDVSSLMCKLKSNIKQLTRDTDYNVSVR